MRGLNRKHHWRIRKHHAQPTDTATAQPPSAGGMRSLPPPRRQTRVVEVSPPTPQGAPDARLPTRTAPLPQLHPWRRVGGGSAPTHGGRPDTAPTRGGWWEEGANVLDCCARGYHPPPLHHTHAHTPTAEGGEKARICSTAAGRSGCARGSPSVNTTPTTSLPRLRSSRWPGQRCRRASMASD